MERGVHLDTHIIVWLRDGEIHKLSPEMTHLIEKERLFFSEFVRLELQYLFEIQKITQPANEIISYLKEIIGLQPSDAPLSKIIQEALSFRWTRDPFDRLITANASILQAYLLTHDKTVCSHYKYCIS